MPGSMTDAKHLHSSFLILILIPLVYQETKSPAQSCSSSSTLPTQLLLLLSWLLLLLFAVCSHIPRYCCHGFCYNSYCFVVSPAAKDQRSRFSGIPAPAACPCTTRKHKEEIMLTATQPCIFAANANKAIATTTTGVLLALLLVAYSCHHSCCY